MSACDIKQLIKTTKFLPDIYIDGSKLDKTELAREIQYHPADDFQSAMQQAAQALIIRHVLLREAEREGLNTDNEEAAFETLISRHCLSSPVDDESCQHYYQQNRHTFTSAPLMVVRHILLAADKNDLEWRKNQRELADEILNRLKKSDDLTHDFNHALRHSACPSRDEGGLLGELSTGQTVPEFERQVFALNQGLAPQPIETRYGYHIVWVVEKVEGKPIPFHLAKTRIFDYLTARRQRQATADYIYQLIQKTRIEGIALKLQAENIYMS